MEDLAPMVALASAGVAALSIASAAALRGWKGWLDLKRLELASGTRSSSPTSSPAARIELADLKERVRKLEAIASGIDL